MRVKNRLLEFLFPSQTDSWLTVLRIGLGLEVTLYSLSLRNDWSYLLSGTARNLAEALLSLESHFVPRLGWFIALAAQLGVHEERILFLAWVCLFASGCALLVGLACRFSAIAAWFLHLCAAKSGGFVSYGMDNFHDHRPFLFDVVAVAGLLLSRLSTARLCTERSAAFRILAARPSAPLVLSSIFLVA